MHEYITVWCFAEESPKTISLKEELETKRCQLEIEIDRFKRENAAISKLRLEREEVSNIHTSIICILSKIIVEFKKTQRGDF